MFTTLKLGDTAGRMQRAAPRLGKGPIECKFCRRLHTHRPCRWCSGAPQAGLCQNGRPRRFLALHIRQHLKQRRDHLLGMSVSQADPQAGFALGDRRRADCRDKEAAVA